jgi:hypothetical protein
MEGRGQITVGCRADLVLVHENGWYPRVRGTIRHGIPIYCDSHLANLSQLSQWFTLEGEPPIDAEYPVTRGGRICSASIAVA